MKRKLGPLLLLCLGVWLISARLPPARAYPLVDDGSLGNQYTTTFNHSTPTSAKTPVPKQNSTATTTPVLLPATKPTSHSERLLTPMVSWSWNPPGKVVAPILLYHHVADLSRSERYYVTPADFEDQMRSLIDWGYTPIPLSRLVQALINGGELPERPVVITFDDGNLDVYQNALPILRQLKLPATIYVVIDQIGLKGYIHLHELRDLVSVGWEIGSHTKTHADLKRSEVNLFGEIVTSRQELGALLGTQVLTFSFPYGLTNPISTRLVQEAGYTSAVGLGGLSHHTLKTQFYLSRIEVRGDITLAAFAKLLPWGKPAEAPHRAN